MGRKILIAAVVIIAALVTCRVVYVQYENKLYSEFKRGLFTGGSYYKRHGEMPSFWHWNKKFADDNFNIDSVLIHNRLEEAKQEYLWQEEIHKKMGIDTVLLPYRYQWHLSPDSVLILYDINQTETITLSANCIQFPDSLSEVISWVDDGDGDQHFRYDNTVYNIPYGKKIQWNTPVGPGGIDTALYKLFTQPVYSFSRSTPYLDSLWEHGLHTLNDEK